MNNIEQVNIIKFPTDAMTPVPPRDKAGEVDQTRLKVYAKKIGQMPREKVLEMVGLWRELQTLEGKKELDWDEKERYINGYAKLHLSITGRNGNPVKDFLTKDSNKAAPIGRWSTTADDTYIWTARRHVVEAMCKAAQKRVA